MWVGKGSWIGWLGRCCIGPFGTRIQRRGRDIVCCPGSNLRSYLDHNGATCSNSCFVSRQASAVIVLSYGEMCLETASLLVVMIALEGHMRCVVLGNSGHDSHVVK